MTQESGVFLFINNNKDITDDKDRFMIIDLLIEDISNLLNTKPTYPIKHGELQGFILNYGLSDLTAYSFYSHNDQQEVGDMIKKCLSLFEPRLKYIDISPIIEDDNYNTLFCFRITAAIEVMSKEIPIVLESRIDNASKRIYINSDMEL